MGFFPRSLFQKVEMIGQYASLQTLEEKQDFHLLMYNIWRFYGPCWHEEVVQVAELVPKSADTNSNPGPLHSEACQVPEVLDSSR